MQCLGFNIPMLFIFAAFNYFFLFCFKKMWDQKFMCVYTCEVRAHQNATQKLSCFTSRIWVE